MTKRMSSYKKNKNKNVSERVNLEREVGEMEKTLQLHKKIKQERDSTASGMIRKELGGAHWQHGGTGKLSGYKTSEDLQSKHGLDKEKSISSVRGQTKSSTSKKGTMSSNVKDIKPNIKSVGIRPSSVAVKPIAHHNSVIDNKTNDKDIHHGPVNGAILDDSFIIENVQMANSEINNSVRDRSSRTEHTGRSTKSNPQRTDKLQKAFDKMDLGLELREFKSPTALRSPGKACMSVVMPHVECDSEISRWLESLCLVDTAKYVRLFAEHEINIANIHLLTEQQLDIMGVTAIGTRNKMLDAIQSLGVESNSSGSEASCPIPNASIKTPSSTKTVASNANQRQKSTKPSAVSSRPLSKGKAGSRLFPHAQPSKEDLPSGRRPGTTRVTSAPAIKAKLALQKKHYSPVASDKHLVNKPRPSSALLASDSRLKSTVTGGKPTTQRTKSAQSLRQADPELEKHGDPQLQELLSIKLLIDDSDRAVRASFTADSSLIDGDADQLGRDATGSSGRVNKPSSHSLDDTLPPPPIDDTEKKLSFIEMQISALEDSLTSPSAMGLIRQLQQQVQAVQREIAKHKELEAKKSKDKIRLEVESEPTLLEELAAIEKISPPAPVLNGPSPRDNILSSDESKKDSEDEFMKLPQGSRPDLVGIRKPAPSAVERPSTGVASQSMTKTQLLKQVRKQNDKHRKHVRHLESELTRLKHKDPMRTCEVPSEHIIFNSTEILGEGAFSKVFRGFYQGTEVAVKRLKVPLSDQDKNYFAAEVSLLSGLRHPQVVLLLGVCTMERLPLMLLEYMSQGSLYAYLHNLEKASLDHAAYFQVARDVALGMNYLHLHRPPVLHLDLKSMNVLLNPQLRAKIADFGFSKLRHDADMVANSSAGKSKASGAARGTPSWMAPELLTSGEITVKVDVYSYAVILWEMLTRQLPYQGCSVFQILDKVRHRHRPEMPVTCPTPLSDLITSCWNHNPAERPQFKDVLSQLDELHLPQQWQNLFITAGISRAALEDIHSTRTLINIVTETLDKSGPVVAVDQATSERLDNGSSDRNVDDVTDHTTQEVHSEICSTRPPGVPLLNLNDSDGCDNGNEMPIKSKGVKTEQFTNISLDWSTDKKSFAPPVPPPVPPLRMSLLDNNVGCKEISPSFLKPVNFLEELKQELENQSQTKNSSESEKLKQIESPDNKVTAGTLLDISSSMLESKKKQLKSTNDPHPSQLRNLNHLGPDGIDCLAAALKKTLEDRRLAIGADNDNNDTIGWTLGSIWSTSSTGCV